MTNHVAVFTRAAEYAMYKALTPQNRSKSQDRLQLLINNTNLINEALTRLAIKMINKAKGENIDREELTINLRNVIHTTVSNYARRAY